MKKLGITLALLVAVAGVAWVAAGGQDNAAAKDSSAQCASKTAACAAAKKTTCDGAACAGECEGSGGCCGKCAGTVSAKAPAACPGCAPVATLAKNGGKVNIDVVRLDNGVSVLFSTPDGAKVTDLQKAVQTVNTSVSRAATSPDVPEGLCTQCTKIIELARSGARARVETISSGAVVVLTGPDASTVRSLQAWAEGLRQAATAMLAEASQAG